jgi:TatA/E family protein of Tat protein translocase
MFGIGVPELLIILAIALIVIGPKKLPDLAKALGRSLNEFKKATREFKDSLDIDEDIQSIKKPISEIQKDIRTSVIDVSSPGKSSGASPPDTAAAKDSGSNPPKDIAGSAEEPKNNAP